MSRKTRPRSPPSEATRLARAGKLNPSTAEPLWREACGKLPKGERPPFRQTTFTLHDSQWEVVNRAIKQAKKTGRPGRLNANSNGNALARICRQWLRQHRKATGRRPGRA